jgi:hypothetical protein
MIEYKKQMEFNKKASLFDLNDGLSKTKRKTYHALAQSVLIDSNHKAAPKLDEIYPKLLNELNDSTSAIPAYVRFQDKE